jgi:sulfur carrier protein ThiS
MVATKSITIRPMGQKAKTVKVPANSKVKDILAKANMSLSEGVKVIANGVSLKAGSRIGKHKEILLVPTVKGGA